MTLNAPPTLYIGLISGTSMDAIDCALVDFENGTPELIDFINLAIPEELKNKILELCVDGQNQVVKLGEVDIELGNLFAESVLTIIAKNNINAKQVAAIGSHGQTIRHQPPQANTATIAFTLQIADPNTIAALTGITTVADFRRKDMAVGGQGAPLVPAFHREVFSSTENDRIIVNIGGMSNITLLKKRDNPVLGFDTGPGNVLLDTWINQHKQLGFDDNGAWAASGSYNEELLSHFLDDDFFKLPPPKSTGREHFNQQWLSNKLTRFEQLNPQDVQATLLELTTTTICDSISPLLSTGEMIVCGGGARNGAILTSLQSKLKNIDISTSTEQGLEGDSVEAIAFAWLAKQTMARIAVDYTNITGSSHPIIMGGIYYSEVNK